MTLHPSNSNLQDDVFEDSYLEDFSSIFEDGDKDNHLPPSSSIPIKLASLISLWSQDV